MNICLVLLAAGNSERFKKARKDESAPLSKLFLEIERESMYMRALDTVSKSKISAAVVTQFDEIADEARRRGFNAVINPDPCRGLSSSIQLGLSCFPSADAVIFMVCDQPFLNTETLIRLKTEFEKTEKGIACLCSGSRRGNPVVFDKKYFPELYALTGDTGGRSVMNNHPDDILCVPAAARELTDIDS